MLAFSQLWVARTRPKPKTTAQNEANFAPELLQIQLQRALNSALTWAPAELLLHSENYAILIVQQANPDAIIHSMLL